MNKLTKLTRLKVCFNHQFLQGSWNFERMQNGGFCFGILPALKALYKDESSYKASVKRHLEFYNTHPYVSAPIMGIVLNLEEAKSNGANISDEQISNIKNSMIGPLAGVGDPVFWFTLRPIIAAVCATMAILAQSFGPILFFLAWNIIRFGFLWYAQEEGYKKGIKLVEELSDDFLKNVSLASSMLGMFVIGVLVQRYVKINIINIQSSIDSIVPGLIAIVLFLICTKLLKKGMSPVLLIMLIFVVTVILTYCGVLII